MRAETDFDAIAPDEIVNLPFDFGKYIASGDTIKDVSAWNCTVFSGSSVSDPTPALRLSGSPTFSGTIVTQTVSTCLAGAIYVMEAVIDTTKGEKLSLWAFIHCVAPGTV